MGAAIAQRMLGLGHDVTVWNRTSEKTRPLAEAGAKVAATPSAVAAASDTVITILTDAAAIDSTYHGKGGLLSGAVSGRLFVEMIGKPSFMQFATRHGVKRPAVMRFTMKLLGNLTETRGGDAVDRLINAVSKMTPAA